MKMVAVVADDADGLLAAMLQRVKSERRRRRRIGVIADAENATLFVKMIVR